jgi:hypothetical protein
MKFDFGPVFEWLKQDGPLENRTKILSKTMTIRKLDRLIFECSLYLDYVDCTNQNVKTDEIVDYQIC